MRLFWFNPENDLALAFGGEHYVAPPAAQRLHSDLALLPAWVAGAGDAVLVADKRHQQWLYARGLAAEIVTPDDVKRHPDSFTPVPWGWSAAARKRLALMGVPMSVMPSDDTLEKLRQLSHRRTTIAIHDALSRRLGRSLSPMPVELTSLDEVERFVAEHGGGFVKAPWSGSGRGVMQLRDNFVNDERTRMWCHGIIKRQGSIMAEVSLQRLCNCAVEFECQKGGIEIAGYSIFENDDHFQYRGGTLAATDQYPVFLNGKYGEFNNVVGELKAILGVLVAPFYNGYFGVDMMLYRDLDGNDALNPCVELNLRMTMGLVAARVGDRYFSDSERGYFMIERREPDGKFSNLAFTLTPTDPETLTRITITRVAQKK